MLCMYLLIVFNCVIMLVCLQEFLKNELVLDLLTEAALSAKHSELRVQVN